MVVTKKHTSSLEKLHSEEAADLFAVTKKSIALLKKVLKPEGFNVGLNLGKAAGAGIDAHLHIHIVPRWQGDTNYMPVIANTKIISQSLCDLITVFQIGAVCMGKVADMMGYGLNRGLSHLLHGFQGKFQIYRFFNHRSPLKHS